jgi:ABC-2 type transport system permease protein
MTPFAAVKLVAGRELRTRLRSRAFRILTAVMVVVVVGFLITLKLVGNIGGQSVGFTPATAALSSPFSAVAEAVGVKATVSTVDQAQGEQMVRDKKLDALVTGTPDHLAIIVRKDLPESLHNTFAVLVRQLALNQQLVRAGADPAAVAAAVNAANFSVSPLEPTEPLQAQRLVLGVIVGILVYVSLLVYGQAVAQGVVEEKSSRVVELLLTTIRPWQLMLGKVAGIGLVGLIQLVAVGVAGLVTATRTNAVTFPTSVAAGIVVWALVWFLLGFIAYALMFASLGALVSRQEDVAGVTTPAMMVIVLPYILSISILPSDPENHFLAIMSVIPIFSPTLMPVRIAMGVASTGEIVLAVGLTVAMIVGLVWLAGRIYGNAVLRMGIRVHLREALRSAT